MNKTYTIGIQIGTVEAWKLTPAGQAHVKAQPKVEQMAAVYFALHGVGEEEHRQRGYQVFATAEGRMFQLRHHR